MLEQPKNDITRGTAINLVSLIGFFLPSILLGLLTDPIFMPAKTQPHFRHRPLIACTGVLAYRLGTAIPNSQQPLHTAPAWAKIQSRQGSIDRILLGSATESQPRTNKCLRFHTSRSHRLSVVDIGAVKSSLCIRLTQIVNPVHSCQLLPLPGSGRKQYFQRVFSGISLA
jgi:hypothetical protein